MIDDARRDVEEIRGGVLEKLRELPALREDLLAARDLLLWVAAFPEPAESFGFSTATALGLREPVERTLKTKAMVEYGSHHQRLRELAISQQP
jgi:hypothetical protein